MSAVSKFPRFVAFTLLGAKHSQKCTDLIALAERLGFAEYDLDRGIVFTRTECNLQSDSSVLSVRVDEKANGATVYQACLRTYKPQIDTVSEYHDTADDALTELDAILEEIEFVAAASKPTAKVRKVC